MTTARSTYSTHSAHSTWPCRICTFENSSNATLCDMCSTTRYTHTDNDNDDDNDKNMDNMDDWKCNTCQQRNSFSSDKCSVCHRRREPIFSERDIEELNEFSAIHFNTTMSPSHSAPNPINDNSDNIIYNNHHNNYHNNDNNRNISQNKSNKNKKNRSSSLNRNYCRNSEIFDIYTNKKKSLLPIDIQISSNIKPKLGPPSIRVHFDDDFNPSTSPSPSSSISSSSQYGQKQMRRFFDKNDGFYASPSPSPSPPDNYNNNNNNTLTNLPLMDKMVRKYSDPKNEQHTTTLLITPQTKKPSEQYSLKQLKQNMQIIDKRIIEILKKRHNDEYYQYIINKTKQTFNHNVNNDMINCRNNTNNITNIGILKCIGCKNEMIHAKCPDINSKIKCYECNILISKLTMEYYHCPNIQISLHKDIGRDLCCICGIKNIIKQEDDDISFQTQQKQVNQKDDKDDEQEIIQFENYLKYQTYKFEQIIPTILMINKLEDFEYIYHEIYNQTLEFGNNSDNLDIISLLHCHSNYLKKQLNRIEIEVIKSKSNKNDIQTECSAISNDITKVSNEITNLMKKINILTKKKQDLQSQMQGILDVLNTMNNHQHELEIISSKTHLFKDKIDSRIKCIQNYNDKVAILSTMFNQKRQNLFGNWINWTSKQVIIQLKYYLKINKLKLNSLSTIIQQFTSKSIKGSDLKNLNQLTFKMMDITDSYDQNILIMWINYVINNDKTY